MRHPLGKAYQCLQLLASQEQQKGGRDEDLPGGYLGRSRQVVPQWGYGRGVGCLYRRGVRQSLCYPRFERYAVRPGCRRKYRCRGRLGRAKRSRSRFDRAWGGRGTKGRTVDQGGRCRIQQWGALRPTMGRREGVKLFQTGSRGGRVDFLVGMGIQIYTTISYASFG